MMTIYLDNHATTPLDPRVLDAMMPFLRTKFGNAASRTHSFGQEAEKAVERARLQVAGLVGTNDPEEIIFTSGATESDNLALQGILAANQSRGTHVVTVTTEHSAIVETCKGLQNEGRAEVTFVPVDKNGMVDPDELGRAITPKTVLVSVMAANNEIGVLQDLVAIGRVCRQKEVLFHSDGAQAVGKISIDLEGMAIDLLSVSAHKMYGPKGVGALVLRKRHPSLKRIKLSPLIRGGGHERGVRSGTLNVPAIVGFGQACEIAKKEMASESARVLSLRQRLWKGLGKGIDRLYLNGHPTKRLAGNLNISFESVEAESLLLHVPELAVSSGAACTSTKIEPSHVLKAIGVPDSLLFNSIRIGLGRFNTEQEVDTAVEALTRNAKRLRDLTQTNVR